MENYWTKENGTWKMKDSGSVRFRDFIEALRPTSKLGIVRSDTGKPVVYIPTHNIHDAYEWFRIFKDGHEDLSNTNFDPMGFWIHAYFDKEASQSIGSFFPNLYLVKTASSTVQSYSGATRRSVDYLDVSANYQTGLIVDNVEVFDGEKILLKDQFFETLTLNAVDTTLSSNTSIFIAYTAGLENNFKSGASLRLKHVNNEFTDNIATSVSIVTSGTPFLRIDLKESVDIADITFVGDADNGVWTKTSYETENGIYIYSAGMLTMIPEMSDRYKTYNQIVYCYQGETNANAEYYLRRIVDVTKPQYSMYPWTTLSLPMYYSKGEAYLIKCEFEYDISVDEPLHPETAPFNVTGTEACYRMLFLDQDISNKIMLHDKNGVGPYADNALTIDLGNGQMDQVYSDFGRIFFYTDTLEHPGKRNVLHDFINNGKWKGYPITGVHADHPQDAAHSDITTELTSINFYDMYSLQHALEYTFQTVDNIVVTQSTNTWRFAADYISSPDILSPNTFLAAAFSAGGFAKVRIDFNKGGTGWFTALEDVFMVTQVNALNNSSMSLDLYPKLDNQFLNEIATYQSGSNAIRVKFESVNNYGIDISNNDDVTLELKGLENAIHKVGLDKLYEFTYSHAITHTLYTASSAQLNINSCPSVIGGAFSMVGAPTGSLIAVTNQSDLRENGIYVFNAIGAPLTRYIKEPLLLTSGYQVQNGFFGGRVLRPNYTLSPGQSGPVYGITQISFTIIGANFKMTIKDVRQQYTDKWDYYGFYYERRDILNTVVDDAEFLSVWDNPVNKNSVEVPISSVYGKWYTPQDYLGSSYLDLLSPSIDIAQMANFTVAYKNIVGAVDRVGFEHNKIFFGIQHRDAFLLNVKKHTWININPATATDTTNLFVHDIYWDYEGNMGTVIVEGTFDTPGHTPGTSESVVVEINKTFTYINGKVALTDSTKGIRPDTASYAHALMNPVFLTGTSNRSAKLLKNLTGIWFKENSEPRVSFRKRARDSKFPNFYEVKAATTANINRSSAPSSIDGYSMAIGDLIMLKNQSTASQNGLYTFNGTGVALTRSFELKRNAYYLVMGGAQQGNSFKATFSLPLVYDTTSITFTLENYIMKSDPRLYLRPVEIAKLGVDNDTQPWQKISFKYDILEDVENQVNIQIGINNRRRIRFVDGLTEFNIINNISDQGQYAWLLDDNVIVEDAVVGCTQTTGSGTGDIIWYTGTWIDGVWEYGLWISGVWESGTWKGGVWNSYPIQDYWTYVTYNPDQILNQLSVWKGGTWEAGIWNGGTWQDGLWVNGSWKNGVWESGTWQNGTFECGRWISGTWVNGIWHGGDFETGEWQAGIFDQVDPTCPSRFGIGAKYFSGNTSARAIWRSGTFVDGEVWAGSTMVNGVLIPTTNDERATIFFSVRFEFGTWKCGTFVFGEWVGGIWESGVWIGGYHATFSSDLAGNTYEMTVDPDEYYSILEVHNTAHRIHLVGENGFNISGQLTSANESTQIGASNQAFWYDAFYEMFEDHYTTPYLQKVIDTNYPPTDTKISLQFYAGGSCMSPAPAYVAENVSLGTLDSRPFICARWQNGTWKSGTWINGWWQNGIWETGMFRQGIIIDGIFGITTE